MRFLVASIFILLTALFSTSAYADGPIVREEVRYERVRYMDNYERNLRRDFERFRKEEARRRRQARAVAEERDYQRYLSRKAKARRSRRFYSEEGRYVERHRPKKVVYREEPRRYRDDEVELREERRVRSATLKRCAPSITGYGLERRFVARARESALKAWGHEVDAAYGREYINPRRALNARYVCEPACTTCTVTMICRFKAAPCRAEF